MTLYWKTENFVTGVNAIDQQHIALFKAINALHDAMAQGNGKDELVRLLGFLQTYTQTHFQDEEELMEEFEYPERDFQKNEHQKFIDDLGAFRETMINEGANMKLLLDVFSRLSNWLAEHISVIDRQMGEYVLKNQAN